MCVYGGGGAVGCAMPYVQSASNVAHFVIYGSIFLFFLVDGCGLGRKNEIIIILMGYISKKVTSLISQTHANDVTDGAKSATETTLKKDVRNPLYFSQ